MAGGYMGKLLFVDLSSGSIKEEALDEDVARKYLGGYGLGAKVLFDRMKPKADPLGPENMLGFVTGPLTGTPALVGSRYQVVGKSPLTGGWGDANSGGFFGPGLKAAGFDAVFFSGIAPKPVYLVIDDGKATLRDASSLWGKDSNETDDLLKAEHGKDAQVACIGPAGEKLSLIACVMNDKGRAAGRSGLGAVMGSKKLKAVVAIGNQKVPLADEAKANELRRHYLRITPKEEFAGLSDYGTCAAVNEVITSGDGPIKNWGGSALDFPNVDSLSDDDVIKYQKRKFACWHCFTGCGGIGDVPEGPFAVREGHKPEYETLASFGFLSLNDKVESVWKANEICNRAGLDTISAGAVIAFAVECYENGILTKEDTGGIELTWGNAEAIVAMAEKVAKREGLGDILANGVKIAAQKIGKGAEAYAIHAGGQEPGMHDPKYTPGLALAFQTDATPGRHTQYMPYLVDSAPERLAPLGVEPAARQDYKDKGKLFAALANMTHVINATGLCLMHMGKFPYTYYAEIMSAVTGWEWTVADLLTAGERIADIRNAFNQREGLNPMKTYLHPRIVGIPPLTEGPNKGITIDAAKLASDYAAVMQWDQETGAPSARRLVELGMADVAAALEK